MLVLSLGLRCSLLRNYRSPVKRSRHRRQLDIALPMATSYDRSSRECRLCAEPLRLLHRSYEFLAAFVQLRADTILQNVFQLPHDEAGRNYKGAFRRGYADRTRTGSEVGDDTRQFSYLFKWNPVDDTRLDRRGRTARFRRRRAVATCNSALSTREVVFTFR